MSSERAREREVLKYYQTWLESSVGFKSPAQTAPLDRLHTDGTGLTSSRDKALVAFAQLGCLRLNVKRALVTLIAQTQQYVLAEATRTLSLVSDSQHASEDGLWFGNSSLPRSQGISENALDPAPYTTLGPGGESYTAPAFVVNDLVRDSRFMHRGYAGKGISFYAGLPIITTSGFAIGVYTVTDDRPRSGLSAEELRFMQDMASTVGSHLDRIRNESARYRGERMVLGLGSFIEGKSTTYGEPGHLDQLVYPEVVESLSRQKPNADIGSRQFKGMSITNADPGALRKAWTSEDPAQTIDSSYSPTSGTANVKSSSTLKTQLALAEQQDSGGRMTHDQNSQSGSSELGNLMDTISPVQSKDLGHIFWRAAKIMRECTAADGVVFYNAINMDDAKGHGKSDASHLDVPSVQQSEASTAGSSDERQPGHDGHISRSCSTSSDSAKQALRPAPQSRDAKSKKCQKLGFSLNIAAGSTASKMSTASLDITEHTLRRFLRRYPRGKMFYYTEEGEVSTSEGDGQHAKSREKDLSEDPEPAHPTSRRKTLGGGVAAELLKVVPGSRNVIFLPLWDFYKQRWAAGTFVWSRRPSQLLHAQDDLTYLKAFGNSIMSEVARLDAVTADKAKTSFIANISHELRSPLHGILGSIEFLQDTAFDAFQSSLITSIESCSKTLLDTLNNLLVFAKINHLSRPMSRKSMQSKTKGSGSDRWNSSANNLETDFDLAIILEEVVEAVYAGQNFRPTGILHDIDDARSSSTGMTTSTEHTSETKKSIQHMSPKSSRPLRITLDIEYLSDWRVHSQPGAIRRLAMNILGNALKYTEKGTIQVSLEPTPQPSHESSSLAICLSVTDTGKGMSANFAQNHAFTPFIQEDSFASGTGLGLSIVQQIVNSLGGKIELQSKRDVGTDVKIWLTLPRARSPMVPQSPEDFFRTVMKETPGLKICILDPTFAKPHPSVRESEWQTGDPVERSIRKTAREWFKMDVLTSSDMTGVAAHFFVYTDPPPVEHILGRHGKPSAGAEAPFIIVAADAVETALLRASGVNHLAEMGMVPEVISQPCGPQKLAKAIYGCLRRLEELRANPHGGSASASFQTWIRETPDKSRPFSENVPPQTDEPVQNSEACDMEQLLDDKPQIPERLAGRHLSTATTGRELNQRRRLPSRDNHYTISRINTSDSEALEVAGEKSPILLVDDNDINLRLLVTFMKKANYSYECATDGLQAVEAYKRASVNQDRAFRYILMDISMPVMDGLTATREIRELERKNNIEPRAVIIALTGLASETTQNDALHSGIDYFRIKPVKFKDLLKILER